MLPIFRQTRKANKRANSKKNKRSSSRKNKRASTRRTSGGGCPLRNPTGGAQRGG